jgi:glycerol-3-phosphate acyltransferase PlsY
MSAIMLSPALLVAVIAYFLGSIPCGLLVVKALGGPDIRAIGSGNIGAANVTRNAGKFAGILTLLLDAGKGSRPPAPSSATCFPYGSASKVAKESPPASVYSFRSAGKLWPPESSSG